MVNDQSDCAIGCKAGRRFSAIVYRAGSGWLRLGRRLKELSRISDPYRRRRCLQNLPRHRFCSARPNSLPLLSEALIWRLFHRHATNVNQFAA